MSGWTCVEDIVAYQLGVQLRDRVLELLDSGLIPHDYRYRDQIAAAARSVPANLAEGFERYKHGQFGYHAGVAKGSLGELKTHLEEAGKRGLITGDCLTPLITLLVRARKTTTGLLRHLQTTEAPQAWQSREAGSPKPPK